MRKLEINELRNDIIVVKYITAKDEMRPPMMVHNVGYNSKGFMEIEYSYLAKDCWLGKWQEVVEDGVEYFLVEDLDVLKKTLENSIQTASAHISHLEHVVDKLQTLVIEYTHKKNIQ